MKQLLYSIGDKFVGLYNFFIGLPWATIIFIALIAFGIWFVWWLVTTIYSEFSACWYTNLFSPGCIWFKNESYNRLIEKLTLDEIRYTAKFMRNEENAVIYTLKNIFIYGGLSFIVYLIARIIGIYPLALLSVIIGWGVISVFVLANFRINPYIAFAIGNIAYFKLGVFEFFEDLKSVANVFDLFVFYIPLGLVALYLFYRVLNTISKIPMFIKVRFNHDYMIADKLKDSFDRADLGSRIYIKLRRQYHPFDY